MVGAVVVAVATPPLFGDLFAKPRVHAEANDSRRPVLLARFVSLRFPSPLPPPVVVVVRSFARPSVCQVEDKEQRKRMEKLKEQE